MVILAEAGWGCGFLFFETSEEGLVWMDGLQFLAEVFPGGALKGEGMEGP